MASSARSLRDLLASGAVRRVGELSPSAGPNAVTPSAGALAGEAGHWDREQWSLATCAGRLVEIGGVGSCSTSLTAATALVRDAQRRREPAAWIGDRGAGFYPPDLAASGVDLEALPVVHVRDGDGALRAADQLLRSGAFGLLVIDLVTLRLHDVPMSAQVRLTGLARQHGTALVVLTGEAGGDAVVSRRRRGSKVEANGRGRFVMASLRASARRESGADGRPRCTLDVAKDKRRGMPWTTTWCCSMPPGLGGTHGP